MFSFCFCLVVSYFTRSSVYFWVNSISTSRLHLHRICTDELYSFVSRANPKNNNDHIILGVLGYKPREFAAQMNLNLANGWGIVRTIMDMCLKMPEGKYVLLKDPNKQVVRLYQVPDSTFEEDADEREVPVPEAENEE